MSELILQNDGAYHRAELDVQISTAKAYPRNQKMFIENAIALATMDEETAESCFYCLVRTGREGRTEIKGASIRLAEIAASCWGNIHAATRISENDGKFVTAEGVAWDLEKNVKIKSEVKRRITGRNGLPFSDDMQAVTGNAACSIALRNAIFKVIPKALIDRVYAAAVSYSVGDQKTIASKRVAVFDRFNKLGIPTSKILDFFNKKSIEEFNAEDIGILIGVGTSIKDGLLSIDDAFSTEVEINRTTEDKLKDLIKTQNKE